MPDTRQPAPDLPARREPAPRAEGPLWVNGDFTLRIHDRNTERVQRVRRPFALLGRIAGSDVRIEDRAVSARHVYLHLDHRGVFGVDLATRTGTRFGEPAHSSGWLRPGQSFEVAGHRIELVEVRLDDGSLAQAGAPITTDPLADAAGTPLVGVTLHAVHAHHVPRALGSELVFVGRGHSCGVRVEGATASRVHCVLLRTAHAAYVVDLIGRGTWLDSQPVTGAAALNDGNLLTIGSARFRVQIVPAGEWLPALRSPTQLPTRANPAGPLAAAWPAGFGTEVASLPDLLPPGAPPLPNMIPAEAQGAMLAWMMGALQAGQAEAMRRQGEFHLALTRLIQQMQRDNAAMLTEHLDRMERIDRELAALRNEIYQRFGSTEAASAMAAAAALPGHTASEPEEDVPPTLRIAPVPKPPDTDPAATASWLITRISQLEGEQRSTWKEMITRITGRAR